MGSIHVDTTLRSISSNFTGENLLSNNEANIRGIKHLLPAIDMATAKLVVGMVSFYNPQLQTHIVNISAIGRVSCTTLDMGSKSLGGFIKTSHTFGPGTTVVVLLSNVFGTRTGIIIGSYDNHNQFNTNSGSIDIAPGMPVGGLKDYINTQILNTVAGNYNGGRPLDSYAGDQTVLNELGGGLIIGKTFVGLRFGYDCGLECHYTDSLLRINAFNLQQFTSGSELSCLADAGDYTEVKRLNSYVVESLGASQQYGSVPVKSNDVEDRATIPSLAFLPKEENQTSFWRSLSFDGYLGNLESKYVVVPNLTVPTRTNKNTTLPQDEYGVFNSHIDTSGAYTVTSAKSIAFVKDCLIPVPKEQYKADDSSGDNTESITAARDANKPYVLDLKLKETEALSTSASLEAASATSDVIAFKRNRSQVMVYERPKDWQTRLVEELEFKGLEKEIADSGYISPTVSTSNYFATLPKVGVLKINERESVKYYSSRSMIVMHDDGSIHIQDGYGAAISLRAGSIDISCPGDLTLRPGRNLIGIAGDTAAVIGGIDTEIVAMAGDTRVHGHRNVTVLGGTDGSGGVLIESKATENKALTEFNDSFTDPAGNGNAYSGIWFKAKTSSIAAISANTYLGNGNENSTVVIDAGDGGGIYALGAATILGSRSTSIITRVDEPAAGLEMVASGGSLITNATGSCVMIADGFLFSGQNGNNTNLSLNANAVLTGSISATTFAGSSTSIAQLDEDAFAETTADIISSANDAEEGLSSFQEQIKEQVTVFKTSAVGDSSYHDFIKFIYPSSELRGIPADLKYLLVEAQWQQQYKTKGTTLTFSGVDDTFPWPGKEALSKFGTLANYDNRLVDAKLRVKRKDLTDPIAVLEEPVDMKEHYIVIGKNAIRSK